MEQIAMEKTLFPSQDYAGFLKQLDGLCDKKYRDFHTSLLNSSLPVMGIRMPLLRKLAKAIAKGDGTAFLQCVGKNTYEERALYGLVLLECRLGYGEFLPYGDKYIHELIENWALCDLFCSGLRHYRKLNRQDFFKKIGTYLQEKNPWVQRAAIVSMMTLYLEEPFLQTVLERVDSVTETMYYVQMAQAWLLAEAVAKQPEVTLAYFRKNCHLDTFTRKKTVQKCKESFRIPPETQLLVRKLLLDTEP